MPEGVVNRERLVSTLSVVPLYVELLSEEKAADELDPLFSSYFNSYVILHVRILNELVAHKTLCGETND